MAYWIIPSNKDIFDLVRCLHDSDYADVACTAAYEVGDHAFVYVTAPYGQILYHMEIEEIFPNFDAINKGKWAKYAGRNMQPRKGPWIRLRFVDNANPGWKPLQPAALRANLDITALNRAYRLNRERVAYILEEFNASKE